jgi:CheY-like chemotaxis protein
MHGFEVVGVASNGIDAISMIKRLSPDCAVLDLVMPGASGLEVLIEARRWSPDDEDRHRHRKPVGENASAACRRRRRRHFSQDRTRSTEFSDGIAGDLRRQEAYISPLAKRTATSTRSTAA